MTIPFVQSIFDYPLIYVGSGTYYFPIWSYPLAFIGRILIFLTTMHLAKLIGKIHGRYAKTLLIGS